MDKICQCTLHILHTQRTKKKACTQWHKDKDSEVSVGRQRWHFQSLAFGICLRPTHGTWLQHRHQSQKIESWLSKSESHSLHFQSCCFLTKIAICTASHASSVKICRTRLMSMFSSRMPEGIHSGLWSTQSSPNTLPAIVSAAFCGPVNHVRSINFFSLTVSAAKGCALPVRFRFLGRLWPPDLLGAHTSLPLVPWLL